jgi:tetratricopeptide (TPR) repeat protein
MLSEIISTLDDFSYRSSLIGEGEKNLMQARDYCLSALQVHKHENFPFKWAIIHATLGQVYIELECIGNTQANMLARASDHYQQALQMLTEDNAPVQWAIIQQGLAIISIKKKDGLKIHHIQQAITLGQSSLRVLTRTAYPLEWARAHAYLGEAYRQATMYADLQELYSGKAVMQEQALRHIEAALQVYTLQNHRHEWAKVKDFEGMIYHDRVRGKQLENLAQASHCFEAAQNTRSTDKPHTLCMQKGVANYAANICLLYQNSR